MQRRVRKMLSRESAAVHYEVFKECIAYKRARVWPVFESAHLCNSVFSRPVR